MDQPISCEVSSPVIAAQGVRSLRATWFVTAGVLVTICLFRLSWHWSRDERVIVRATLKLNAVPSTEPPWQAERVPPERALWFSQLYCESILTSPLVVEAAVNRKDFVENRLVVEHPGYAAAWLASQVRISFPDAGNVAHVDFRATESEVPDAILLLRAIIDEMLNRARLQDRVRAMYWKESIVQALQKANQELKSAEARLEALKRNESTINSEMDAAESAVAKRQDEVNRLLSLRTQLESDGVRLPFKVVELAHPVSR